MNGLSADTRAAILEAELVNGLKQMQEAALLEANAFEAAGEMRFCGRCELAAAKIQETMICLMECFGSSEPEIRERLEMNLEANCQSSGCS
jgi:hypothetical protein